MVIEDWINETTDLIAAKYNELGLRASGDFERNLSGEYKQDEKSVRIEIKGVDYTYYLVNGRNPGSFPPVDAIMKWIDEKPINFDETEISKNSLAYLIGRKIATEGIKVPSERNDGNLLESISKQRVNKLTRDIGGELVEKITSEIIKKWQ